MELIYIWFKDASQFQENQGIELSGKFRVSDSFDSAKQMLSVDIQKNENWSDDFFGNKIVNITAIIGKNGTGKTTLMDCIVGALCLEETGIPWPIYVAVFFDGKENQIYIKHNNNGHLRFFKKTSSDFSLQGEKIEINLKTGEIHSSQEKEFHIDAFTVYYSPSLDLRDFKALYSDESLINVSTDFLLDDDSNNNNLLGQKQLQIHRYKNVLRQIDFVSKFKDQFSGKISLPDEISISSINQANQDIDNLHYDAREIRDWFLFDNSNEKGRNRGEIRKDIDHLQNEILRIQTKQDRNSNELKEKKLEETKLFMLWHFAQHFFSTLNSEPDGYYEYDLEVQASELDGKSSWEAFRFFLKKQAWITDKTKQNALNLLELIEGITIEMASVLNGIEKKLKINDFVTASNIVKAYLLYLEAIPIWSGSNSISDFLQFNWRDLSSGEKAMLDLFSRMYYAKRISQGKQEKKKAGWFYIFLDEGESGFHPEWQRQYLDMLIKSLPSIFKGSRLQIFLTSHSPLVLSDLPSSNVVFLDRQGATTVVDKNALTKMSNTFAANIHTLLAESFFLEKGLIGDFAQRKIGEALDSMEEPIESKKEEIRQLISMIGEPVIRNKMEQYFLEKYGHPINEESVDVRIERLKKELADLQNKKNPQK